MNFVSQQIYPTDQRPNVTLKHIGQWLMTWFQRNLFVHTNPRDKLDVKNHPGIIQALSNVGRKTWFIFTSTPEYRLMSKQMCGYQYHITYIWTGTWQRYESTATGGVVGHSGSADRDTLPAVQCQLAVYIWINLSTYWMHNVILIVVVVTYWSTSRLYRTST